MPVNQEKLQKLQSARIGGKGTSRRKKKIVHKTATDDKKVQVRQAVAQDWAALSIAVLSVLFFPNRTA